VAILEYGHDLPWVLEVNAMLADLLGDIMTA
jgi:hypothetical protein